MLTLKWKVPGHKSNWASYSVSSVTQTHTHTQCVRTKLSKADKLSRTGPSSSSSFIHQHSTLWPAHPIEQTFILSILQFPQQSSFPAGLGLFTVQRCGHVGCRSQRCSLAYCDPIEHCWEEIWVWLNTRLCSQNYVQTDSSLSSCS